MKKLILALLLLSAPAAAQECVPATRVITQATNAVPGSIPRMMLTGTQKDVVLDAYNRTEPVSNFEVDGIVVITADNVPVVFLVGFTGNCTVFADTFPADVFKSLVNGGV